MELIQFIQSKVRLPNEAAAEINNAFKTEVHSKGIILIRPDSLSQKIYFIEKGLLRTFYYKMDRDITQFFFDENFFTAPLTSIFYNKSEPYAWETLEQSTVRTILYRDLAPLLDKYPTFQQFFFQVAIDMVNLLSIKLESLQFQTADERYRLMTDMYPDLLLRASLGHIASYLGISQQTLSTIRGKR